MDSQESSLKFYSNKCPKKRKETGNQVDSLLEKVLGFLLFRWIILVFFLPEGRSRDGKKRERKGLCSEEIRHFGNVLSVFFNREWLDVKRKSLISQVE